MLMAWAAWFEGFNQTLCSAVDIVRQSGRSRRVPEKETAGGDERDQKRVVELSRRASSLLLEKEKLDDAEVTSTMVALKSLIERMTCSKAVPMAGANAGQASQGGSRFTMGARARREAAANQRRRTLAWLQEVETHYTQQLAGLGLVWVPDLGWTQRRSGRGKRRPRSMNVLLEQASSRGGGGTLDGVLIDDVLEVSHERQAQLVKETQQGLPNEMH